MSSHPTSPHHPEQEPGLSFESKRCPSSCQLYHPSLSFSWLLFQNFMMKMFCDISPQSFVLYFLILAGKNPNVEKVEHDLHFNSRFQLQPTNILAGYLHNPASVPSFFSFPLYVAAAICFPIIPGFSGIFYSAGCLSRSTSLRCSHHVQGPQGLDVFSAQIRQEGHLVDSPPSLEKKLKI